MEPIEIILIILGLIIIGISCKIVDRTSKEAIHASGQENSIKSIFSDEEINKLREEISQELSKTSEEIIDQTDNSFSKLSNETILAVSEYSDQILEKIRKNHEEVVFLYNMLNEKEKELKNIVKEFNVLHKRWKEIKTSDHNIEKTETPNSKPKPVSNNSTQPLKTSNNTISVENEKIINHEQILTLYSQGRSIVEISKLLDLGQGEVKLVVDLYHGKK
ncbi:MAG: hypothetical protein GX306_00385 [Clostridiales bacterium]|nr:hypothetical protein [Clostridiales bacterium]